MRDLSAFRRCVVLKCEKLREFCTDSPVRFPSNAYKTNRHIAKICLLFGTPMQIKNLQFRKNSINTSALLSFAHYRAGAGAQFTGLCTGPPVRFPSYAYKTKRHITRICLLFGTPIGNRTLVSAVRGRRLEPLDHEGKSILLCDNSIIFVHTQAKIDNLRIFYLMNFLIKNYQLHIDFYYLIM